jgi:hypothetical protein
MTTPLLFCPLGKAVWRHCRQGECAWWNHQVGACAIAVLAMQIGWEIAKAEGENE